MLKVSVTGNIGSGKTTICKVFEILGVPVFYADLQAKECLDEKEIKEAILKEFGASVFDKNKKVVRKLLAELVFRDKKKLESLNQIIHPRVNDKYANWAAQLLSTPYCIKEAAIVFETATQNKYDYNIMVYAPDELLIERTMKRDGQTIAEVNARLANQMSQKEKINLANFVINNDNKTLVIPQIIELHNILLSLSKNKLS